MSDDTPIDETTGGLDRRSLIKRGAIVGGALVWTTPVVQAIASPAFGAEPSENDDDGDPVCLDGGASDRSYFIKFNIGGTTEFSLGNGANCVPGGFDDATTSYPPGVVASDFSIGVPVKTLTSQTVDITLPAGFVVFDGSVKAGNGVDADANMEGCFNEDKMEFSQSGRVVTVTTTNTDGKGPTNPGFSFVTLVYTGCVPVPV